MTTAQIREQLAILKMTNQEMIAGLVQELFDRIEALSTNQANIANTTAAALKDLSQHLNE